MLLLVLFCRYAFQIVLQVREIMRALPSLVDVKIPEGKHLTVCGDVHGQVRFLLFKTRNCDIICLSGDSGAIKYAWYVLQK